MAFQELLRQHQAALGRKASLLATLATTTLVDDSRVQDSADDPIENEGTDLVALADGENKIVMLHTTGPHFTMANAETLLAASVSRHATSDWWYSDAHLYQVVLQPVQRRAVAPEDPQAKLGFVGPQHDAPEALPQTGTVVVGREIGYAAVHDMGRMSSSMLAFSYGPDVVASTLNALDEHDLGLSVRQWARQGVSQGQIQIADEPYFSISMPLTNALGATQVPGAQLCERLRRHGAGRQAHD